MLTKQFSTALLLAACSLGLAPHAAAQQSPAPGRKGQLASALSGGEQALLEPDEAFKLNVAAKNAGTITAELVPASGYYLYKERMRFALKPGGEVAIRAVKLPAGEMKNDLILGRTEVYKKAVPIEITLDKAAGGKSVTLVASYQGCQEKLGVCYPPIEKSVNLVLPK
ncbi:MAG: protein-disulfide reductase DsbD N-terminal domain-containing protein [Bacillota bacterium]